jgi:hypothetical protein
MARHYIKLFWAEPSRNMKLARLIMWTVRHILLPPIAKVTNSIAGTVHSRDGGEDQPHHYTRLPAASLCCLHCHELQSDDAVHQYRTSAHVCLTLHTTHPNGNQKPVVWFVQPNKQGKALEHACAIPLFRCPFSYIPIPQRWTPRDGNVSVRLTNASPLRNLFLKYKITLHFSSLLKSGTRSYIPTYLNVHVR